MQEPHILVNWISILASVLVAFIIGGIWYGPLFGKAWARMMGFDPHQKPDSKTMLRAFIMQIVGCFLTAYVLTHSSQVWRPSVWGVGTDGSDTTYGFMSGFFTWMGFYVPLQLSKVGWENRSWKLFFINAGHDFVSLQVVAQILNHWR